VGAADDADFTEGNAGSLTTIASRLLVGALTDRLGGRRFAGFAILAAVGMAFGVLALCAFATRWGL
jgi:nitrate/nitrite transporter NarK